MGHRRVFHVFIAAIVALAAASQATAQVGRVSGVVKGEDGQPLKGATITVENPNIGMTFTSTTDEKGRFQVIGLRAGTWRFVAQAPGFAPDAGSMPVRMGGPNPPVTFILKRNGVAAFGLLGGITNKELQSDLAAADALFAESKWDDAASAYRNVVSKSPALAIVNLQVAAAYRGKKDFPAAIEAYETLLKSDPDNAKAHVGIAMTNLDRGDRAAAERQLLKAAEGQNVGREVFYSLADVKLQDNQGAEAARWFKKAAEADPFWGKPVYQLGLIAMKNGNADEAAQLMNKVAAIDPASPEAALAKSSLESLKK